MRSRHLECFDNPVISGGTSAAKGCDVAGRGVQRLVHHVDHVNVGVPCGNRSHPIVDCSELIGRR